MVTTQATPVRISASVTEIDPSEWKRLFPFLVRGYSFFRTLEETLTNQFKFYYLSFYEDSKITGIAPCFIMDYSLETTVEGPLKRVAVWIRKRVPRFLTLRVLICGSPLGTGALGFDRASPPEVSEPLVTSMSALARKEKASLLAFKDFSESYDLFLKPILKRGFHRIPGFPSVELDLNFKSFEEYFASLSRATRKDLKRKFKKVDGESNLRMEVRTELGEWLDRVYELYLNTFEKSEVRFEKITRSFLERIAKNMPEETRYFLWFLGEQLVAFDLCLVSGDLLIDEYVGMDYEVARRYPLYFLTFRDIYHWCLEHGIRRYESSALNYEPKKRLDFHFISQYLYVKYLNPVGNLAFGLLCRFLKPENFDPVLKSLKEREKQLSNEKASASA